MILAGGRASRLGGRPKGLERLGDARIVDRVAAALRAAVAEPLGAPLAELLLVSDDPDADRWLGGARVVRDLVPGQGPLGGLQAALTHARAPVLVVAWDMPFVPAPLLAELCALGAATGADAAVPGSDARGGVEPLCGWYHPACLPAIARRLAAGADRSLAGLLGEVRVARLDARRVAVHGDPARLFANVNTTEDLARARRLADAPGVGAVEVDVERVTRAGTGGAAPAPPARDVLAVEEPLEIRLHLDVDGKLVRKTVSITMRTPGDDAGLAAGFLFTEGILDDPAQVETIRLGRAGNVARVWLRRGTAVDLARLERHFYTTSSCGVCGKTSIDALRATARWPLPAGAPVVDAALVHALPQRLRDAQPLFERTGGLHASALFDAAGTLRALREDVGRHNALDKVVGAEFLAGRLPAHDRILLVSGRASFELVQKAVMAGIPILAAVGAPSSLAVELAASAGMTLLGFVRDGRFNVYAGGERVRRDAG